MGLFENVYTVQGTRVWLPDVEMVWKSAVLNEDYKGQKSLKVTLDDGKDTSIQVAGPKNLPPLRNPDILIGENDLTSLSYLHEPAVLYNLQVRFVERNYIYTYCGIVLVAINPYESLPIYDNDTITAYSGQSMNSLDPHIFAVAEEAYKRLAKYDENQSLIVSGESGAGKTVSAKYAMRYFATVCGAEAETQIEKRVLASNPIMEGFGNAKTTRNDNSSRFGKYIQIRFSKSNNIVGADMRTYLLEKSRVVYQAPDERNYHIFYQLCSNAGDPDFAELKLDEAEKFDYLNQGSAQKVDSIDDFDDFANLREAFSLMGINDLKQMCIFRILSGILHMGNVNIIPDNRRGDSCQVHKIDVHLSIMADLLGIDQEQMRYWLCHRKIVTANETLTKPLTHQQALNTRNALSKHIYSQLFNWIVSEVNKLLSANYKSDKFIGVLDIYGFETFEVNSFEQFCINYANEKLQQQFCLHVFKLEQEEYIKEEIEWSFIDFHDNQPCIELIEGRLGVLDLLDEECKMPNASDKNWNQKLYDKHGKNEFFEKPRLSQTSFIIIHFADKVEYLMDGFVEKNRDTILEEHVNILKASQYELVAELFENLADPSSPTKTTTMLSGAGGGSASATKRQTMTSSVIRSSSKDLPGRSALQRQMRKTVGSQFRESLKLLMETLFKTTPHYIRCIKPNDLKLPFHFEPQRAIQQLRACGVLETIRISAAGYPSRWTYPEFFQRYRVLAHSSEINRKDMKMTCQKILNKFIQDKEKFQIGRTKIFFRAGQVAYLEKLRTDKLRSCGVLIQKVVRGFLAKRKFQKVREMALKLQKYARGMLARRQARFLLETRCATKIQATWRRFYQQAIYKKIIRGVIFVQSYARGLFGRNKYVRIVKNVKATLIQKVVRGWLARRRYHKVRRGVVKLQAHVRRRAAKKLFKKLKAEARSVEHIKKVAKGLENKIIELQQKLTEKNKEVIVLKEDQSQLVEARNEMAKMKLALNAAKQNVDRLRELELLVSKLTGDLEVEKLEKEALVTEMQAVRMEKEKLFEKMRKENEEMRKKLDVKQVEMQEYKSQHEALLNEQLKQVREELTREFESERSHHQRMIKDYTRLQQRYENLQGNRKVIMDEQPALQTAALKKQISNGSDENGEMTKLRDGDVEGEDEMKKAKLLERSKNSSDSSLLEQKDSTEEVNLIARLQMRIRQLEWEKSVMRREMNRKSGSRSFESQSSEGGGVAEGSAGRSDPDKELQDLEIENTNLKNDLEKLQRSIMDGEKGEGVKSAKLVLEQLEVMNLELNRRREECIQLRTVLASMTRSAVQRGMTSSGRDGLQSRDGRGEFVPDDGELEMAYKTQKDLNKLLENELQRMQKSYTEQERDMRNQIEELKKENMRQQKLIGQNLTMTPKVKMEATMQHEITRLTSENLDLREQIDKMNEQIIKLKKALKIYAKRLKNSEAEMQDDLELDLSRDEQQQNQLNSTATSNGHNMPVVRHFGQREYNGMFEYRKEDEPIIIKSLIIEMKPRLAMQHLPGLPAYIIFMCIRHTDHMNDDDKVRSLLTNTINGIKKTVKRFQEDSETLTLWLSNTCRLLHNLKQYSGEKVFQTHNTSKQNEHCLKNFDLSEYRQILSDLAVWIFQGLIKLVEAQIHPFIVSAILEHEAIAGLTAGKPTGAGLRGRNMAVGRRGEADAKSCDEALDRLIKSLDNLMHTVTVHMVDPELVQQIFRQIFYFICANSLNNLLLRKDMCHWTKGMQMRYNLSHMEQWLRDHKMNDTNVQSALDPIIQASQLLQARKTDTDVDSVCDMCSKLTTSQIIKILNLYTPVNEFEERVPITFIRKIQDKLSYRQDSTQQLLMDTKYLFAITFPFNPSTVGLHTLQVPPEWKLSVLKRL
ncbi:hypothetical protein HELRODRAFT_189498 [Helobdella robusta]|uniref:Myosin motor domain-containing protein n=1 Tax=Helobdella robusta TaxID=6412 RepID=T1FR37_HELRO|nr:hypothetical protein HELRODRAFT_189498 [Helobdella robusta]ESN92553.1 hypothetical protein HELRODRAFT_189498 [Helobdella robusta]